MDELTHHMEKEEQILFPKALRREAELAAN